MARFGGVNKGETVNISKINEEQSNVPLKRLHIGLGWDFMKGNEADLDAFIVQVDAEGHEIDTVYFGHRTSDDGSIKHSGDNLTGEGEGDDEVLFIELSRLNPATAKLMVGVNVYSCRMTFDKIQNAFIRALNADSNEQLVKYDLSNEAGANYCMHLGDIIKVADGTWDFKAIGEGTKDRSISDFAQKNTKGKAKKGGLFGNLFK